LIVSGTGHRPARGTRDDRVRRNLCVLLPQLKDVSGLRVSALPTFSPGYQYLNKKELAGDVNQALGLELGTSLASYSLRLSRGS